MQLAPNGYGAFFKGLFIVIDYVGEEVETITQGQYDDGVIQLQRMGKIGVYYPDVAPRNLRVKDGKLIFIDFSSCSYCDHPDENLHGIEMLDDLWITMGDGENVFK